MSPVTVVVVLIWFERRVVLTAQRAASLRFSSSVQSLTNWDWYEELPELELWVKGRVFSRRFMMDCNPSEASWIVGALGRWRQEVGASPSTVGATAP